MKRTLALLAALTLAAGCKKDAEAPPAPAPKTPQVEDTTFAEQSPDGGAKLTPHSADALAEVAQPKLKVDEALVLKYLDYRKRVVERGRAVVKGIADEQAKLKAEGTKVATSVQMQKAAEEFAVKMRAIEEEARKETGLSREDVVGIGQVTGEVLAARQIWKRSGGDEAVAAAKAKLAALKPEDRAKVEQALNQRAQGFSDMRDAVSARKRFGDEAVDAVLKHEDALWDIQREGAQVMSQVY